MPDSSQCSGRDGAPGGQAMYPTGYSSVEFVLKKTERDQDVHVEEILHGKVDRIAWISWLLKSGTCGPALGTGRPVMGSRRTLALAALFRRGVSTMRPLSALASSESPVRSPSLLRMARGKITCPLMETLVCTVPRSARRGDAAFGFPSSQSTLQLPLVEVLLSSGCVPSR